jgi:hypothetical protein
LAIGTDARPTIHDDDTPETFIIFTDVMAFNGGIIIAGETAISGGMAIKGEFMIACVCHDLGLSQPHHLLPSG